MPQVPIQTLVPGAAPIELVAYYEAFLWYYPDCEPVTKHWYVRNVRPDWVMFDVGANIGYYTIARRADRGPRPGSFARSEISRSISGPADAAIA